MKTVHLGERYTEISGQVRDDFVAELLDLREGSDEDICLDFTGVERLSSIALAAVGKLHVWMGEHDRALQITGLGANLAQLFEITGLSQMLNIIASDQSGPDVAGEE